MTTHLFAPPGDYPDTLCGRSSGWGVPLSAVHGRDLRLVDCPDCLGRFQVPIAAIADDDDYDEPEPYTGADVARLRHGFKVALWICVPLWTILLILIWRYLSAA